MRLTLSSRPLFLFSRPAPSPVSVSCRPPFTLGALSPAGQGGTGDPRLPCRTRPSLRRHPLAGGGMSPHAAPSRPFALAIHQIGHFRGRTALLPLPSTKTAFLVDEWPFRLRHPPKWHFWWTNGPFALAIHENGTFGGRMALSPPAVQGGTGGPGRYRRPWLVPVTRARNAGTGPIIS